MRTIYERTEIPFPTPTTPTSPELETEQWDKERTFDFFSLQIPNLAPLLPTAGTRESRKKEVEIPAIKRLVVQSKEEPLRTALQSSWTWVTS